jgi:hypothetical protein
MQRIILAVVAATLGFAGSAFAQHPQRPVMPSSRWVLNGHSTAALGTSVGDDFGSIDTHSGLGAGVEVGYRVTPRLLAYAGVDIASRASTRWDSTVTSASPTSRPAPDSASRSRAVS